MPAVFEGHPLQNTHELHETQVADLAPPQPFHAFDIEVFEGKHIVTVA